MEQKIKTLQTKANKLRKAIIEMIAKANSGHPGGSLSAAEIISVLFFHILKHNPEDSCDAIRDRFHLSKGHCCPALYAALAECGYIPQEQLCTFRRLNSILQGHPDHKTPGIEVSSGSLGQGLSIAAGMALAGRLDKLNYRVYCLMGDGELQEGNIWEAAMAAAHYKIDSLCGIVDYNKFQIDGSVDSIMAIEPLVKKWEAFGWNVIECDGHKIADLINAFDQARAVKGKPSVIIAHTIKGKGVSFMENTADFHGKAPNPQETEIALKELDELNKSN